MNLKHLLAVAHFNTDQETFLRALLDRLAALEAHHNRHAHSLTAWEPEGDTYLLDESSYPTHPFEPDPPKEST